MTTNEDTINRYMQRIDDGDIHSMYLLGLHYYKNEQYGPAKEWWTKASSYAHYNSKLRLENLTLKLNNIPLEHFKNMEDPEHLSFTFAELNLTNGNYEMAISQYKKTLELALEVKESENFIGYIYYGIATTYARNKEAEKAIENYKQAIYSYNHVPSMNSLAFIYKQRRSLPDAIKYYMMAADAGYPDSMFNLGVINMELINYGEAYRYFEMAFFRGVRNAILYMITVIIKINNMKKTIECLHLAKKYNVHCQYDYDLELSRVYALLGDNANAKKYMTNHLWNEKRKLDRIFTKLNM